MNCVTLFTFSYGLHLLLSVEPHPGSSLMCLVLLIAKKSLVTCIEATIAFCDLWTSTLFAQAMTYSLVTSMVFFIVVSSLIMSDVTVLSFMPIVNYFFSHLSYS